MVLAFIHLTERDVDKRLTIISILQLAPRFIYILLLPAVIT